MKMDEAGLPEFFTPGALSVEMLRHRYADMTRFIYGRKDGNENAFIVLIGGGAAVGKSTLAWEVASVLGIRTVISTDMIRQIVRHERPDDVILQAETWMVQGRNSNHPHQLYQGLACQSERLQPLIEDLCTYLLSKGMPTIIEGIHLIPSLELMRLTATPNCVVFFIDATKQRILLNYQCRAVSTHMRGKSEGFSDVDLRIQLHEEIIKRARESGLAVLPGDDWPVLINTAISQIGEKLGAL